MVESGCMCTPAVVDSGKAGVDVVVGGRVVVTVVVEMVCFEVFLVRTGMVVFHWWVEKGLVTLAGSVMSWSPTVDSRDSGTVGRSQAGRLLTGSSKLKLLLLEEELLLTTPGETVCDAAD